MTLEYSEWFERLRDRQARMRIDVRVRRLGMGNPGQHRVLTGGDKSSQQEDITTALKLAKELE